MLIDTVENKHQRVSPPPGKAPSTFRVGMFLLLDNRLAEVTEVMSATSMSMLCRVRIRAIEGGTREAVLKVLSRKSFVSDHSRQRFSAECYSAAQLSSRLKPGRVPVVYSTPEECFALVEGTKLTLGQGLLMEPIPGKTLRDFTKENSCDSDGISTSNALLFAFFGAGVLGELHAEGIIHGDVKEDAFMRRPDGTLCLIDFGLSRPPSTADDEPITGIEGTLGYIPPEVVIDDQRVGQFTPQYDLYGLGTLLYNAYCDRGHYGYRDLMHASGGQETIRKKGLYIPSQRENSPLVPIIKKLMADKEARYKNAGEVLADLQKIVCTCEELEPRWYENIPKKLKGLIAQVVAGFRTLKGSLSLE